MMSNVKSYLTIASRRPRKQILRLEPLEDRQLLSTCHVTRLTDQGIGKGFRGDLRYCINKVNAEPGPDVIDFTVTGTIKLNAGLPPLATDIHVQGPGSNLATIDAQEKDRVFNVTIGANVEIADITITNGLVWAGAFQAFGGGIINAGNLLVRNSVISENTALSAAYYGAGGGIYNAEGATLTVIESVLSGNLAVGEEFAGGGGICNSGTASIYSSAIVANTAEDWSLVGAGLGAGISNTCPPPGPPVSGFLLVHNSTVHSNVAKESVLGDKGIGGINSNGVVIVSHSTIASNTGWGVGPLYGNGQTYVRNSIIAGNSAGDVKLALASSGYNLIGDSEGGSGFDNTDLLNVDPMVGPLQDNGGPTPTAALLPGSPAIDAGDNTDAPEWDQRGPGFPRIVNGTIDIGAFEVQASPLPERDGGDFFDAPINLVAGNRPTSVAATDLNNDEIPDLVVANSYSNTVMTYIGKGDGRFRRPQSYATGPEPSVVAVGDLNHDGRLDLVVSNWSGGTVSVLLAKPTFGFFPHQTYGVGSNPGGILLGQFDADGNLDLAVANSGTGNVSVLLGIGDGSFQTAVNYATAPLTKDVRSGDFNDDGQPDLVAASQQTNSIQLLLNNGDGTFAAPVGYAVGSFPTGLVVADVDGDGRDDVVAANYGSNNVTVLLGTGLGTFQPEITIAAGSQPHGVAVGDIDQTGGPDLVVALKGSAAVAVLLNNGDGTFQAAQTFSVGADPFDVIVNDMNGDGLPDVVTANGGSNNLSLLLHVA